MKQRIVTKTFLVGGMTCPSCEMRIENRLKMLPGVVAARASYGNENVQLQYDPNKVELPGIIGAIEKLGYEVKSTRGRAGLGKGAVNPGKKPDTFFLLGAGVVIFGLYLLIQNTVGFNFIPAVNQNMGYFLLFIVGLITSLHCIAMCGGINLSQCVAYKTEGSDTWARLRPSLLYNAGRVLSYTVLGGMVGSVGSVIGLSGTAKGLISIIAGIFMIIMGLNMLNSFPWLRKLTPRMPRFFGHKIQSNNGRKGPFIVGLLNGFMPCGPLQTMQIYALGTGGFVTGALSMFMFSLGTLPLMFGLGAVSSFLSGGFTTKMMKVSAALVIVLGVIMLNRGFALSNIDPFASASTNAGSGRGFKNAAVIKDGVQYITTELSGRGYPQITVQKGIPVKWTIKADVGDINGCNSPMILPRFDKEVRFVPGDNVVEFTPSESGAIPYSCWMGMMRSRIIVVDDLGDASAQASSEAALQLITDNAISTDTIQVAETSEEVQKVDISASCH